MTTKTKLKWHREGYDRYEDQYLIPVGQERTEDDDLNVDAAVAWIKIAYSRVRFFNGRGGEGESRPDSYVAYVQDTGRRRHLGRAIVEGATETAHVGGLFSDKMERSFTTLRAAKKAIAAELAKIEAESAAHFGHKGGECERCDAADKIIERLAVEDAHGGAWQSTDELPNELCMDAASCSVCGGPLMPLGALGTVNHFRCRNCGMDSHARSAS
jgi:hypothetical protein